MKSISNFAKDMTSSKSAIVEKKEDDIELKDVKGKKAGARGAFENGDEYPLKWGVDEPTDDDLLNDYTEEELEESENAETLYGKFLAEDPFFVQGEAGWGKTSIIKDMAKRFGRSVITVYLDKAVATDLGGIPVPLEDKKHGGARQDNLLPPWAQILEDNPDKKFLLFFDEMNQAQPDVQNALMPIVLDNTICGKKFGKKDSKGKVIESNFFVGAAGNFESENRAVFELSGPLKSRFKPIIVWETDWKSAFKFVRKKWDGKITPEVFKIVEANLDLFDNPRELDQKLFATIYTHKKSGKGEKLSQRYYTNYVNGLATEKEISRKNEKIKEVANAIYEYVHAKDTEVKGRSGSSKSVEMIPNEIIKKIGDGMVKGYIRQVEDGKNVYYGISRENIFNPDFFVEDDGTQIMNAEMIRRAVRKLEAEGKKFRFEKDDDWRNATDRKYKDPTED